MLTRSLSLAAVIVGLVGSAALTAVRGVRQSIPAHLSSACTTAWSNPYAPLLGDGYLHIAAPQIVATRAGIALLGDASIALAPTYVGFIPIAGWPRDEGMAAGFLLRPNGEVDPIPGPPGVRAFIEVRAAGDAGTAHVFWGGSTDTSSSQTNHVTSLWYARYDGIVWTQPELILADTTLMWIHQLTSIVVSRGRVHVTALVDGDSLSPDVLHVVRGGDGRGTVARLGFQALYTDLIADRDGTLWLATILGDVANRARVLVRRSPDDGRTWSEPVVVYRSGHGTAYDPRLAVTPSGKMYAAWIEEPPRGAGRLADRIGGAVSVDRGATWNPLAPITAEPRVRDLWVVPEGATGIQVAFHTDDAQGRVVATRGNAGAWEPRSVLGGPSWFAASLAAPTPDTLYLVWHEWRVAVDERAPTMWISRRRSCLE